MQETELFDVFVFFSAHHVYFCRVVVVTNSADFAVATSAVASVAVATVATTSVAIAVDIG